MEINIPPRTKVDVRCVYHKNNYDIPYTIHLKSRSLGRLSQTIEGTWYGTAMSRATCKFDDRPL